MRQSKEDPENPRGLWNSWQMAKALGQSEKTVRQKVWLRQIEFVRIGRSIRFKPETAERLIEAGTVLPVEVAETK